MKHTLLLLVFVISLNAKLTVKQIKNLSLEQLNVLNVSYQVGEHYSFEKNMGIWLAAIAYVENKAKLKDLHKNHICGAHQIDYNYAKVPCKSIESNPFLSAYLALVNLQFWKYQHNKLGKIIRKRTLHERIRKYNVGYTNHKHQFVYLKKVVYTYTLLLNTKNLWLK